MAGKEKAGLMWELVWMRANKIGELPLTFKTPQDLRQARFALYNLAKKVKNGKRGSNLELEMAVEDCMINVEGTLMLVVRQKKLAPLLLDLAEQLGVDLETLADSSEEGKVLEESQRRMMELQKLLEEGPSEEEKAIAARKEADRKKYGRG